MESSVGLPCGSPMNFDRQRGHRAFESFFSVAGDRGEICRRWGSTPAAC